MIATPTSCTRRTAPRRAFTLAEMVVALTIVGILMTGLGSAILIASRSLPNGDTPTESLQDTAAVLDIIADELVGAIWIQEHTATAITFSIADRDGDGNAEKIRYSWDGAPGDALKRAYNGGTAQAILTGVQDLALGYDTRVVVEEYPGAPIESAEIELSSHENLSSSSSTWVSKSKFAAQYFQPTISAGVTSWRVTRALVFLSSAGTTNDTLIVRLQKYGADGFPSADSADTLAEVSILESLLSPTFAWQKFDFDGSPALAPGDGLYLFLLGNHTANSAELAIEDGVFGGVRSTDTGATWSFDPFMRLQHYVYGKTLSPGPPQTATRTYVTGVSIALESDGDPAINLDTAVHTLNQPELLRGLWESEFDSDPTLDHNGDGTGDWNTADASLFDPLELGGGIWSPGSTELLTAPNGDFAGVITAIVSARAKYAGEQGITVTIPADHVGGLVAPIEIAFSQGNMGDGVVSVSAPQGGGAAVNLVTTTGLPNTVIVVRLVVDPALDTVAVWIAGVHAGTFSYTRVAESGGDFNTHIVAPFDSGEVAYVSIRVSE